MRNLVIYTITSIPLLTRLSTGMQNVFELNMMIISKSLENGQTNRLVWVLLHQKSLQWRKPAV